jgi:hypothetical protein
LIGLENISALLCLVAASKNLPERTTLEVSKID